MEEEVTIVNDNDEIIGYKPRSEVNDKKDIYRNSALWLTNFKGQVLLAQRKKTKDKDPGVWGPAVAGTVEKGESYEESIYKEAKEEIGLEGIELSPGPKARVHQPRNFFTQWYTATIDRNIEDFSFQEEEVEKIKWITKEFLKKDVKENPDNYIPMMSMALELFKQR